MVANDAMSYLRLSYHLSRKKSNNSDIQKIKHKNDNRINNDDTKTHSDNAKFTLLGTF